MEFLNTLQNALEPYPWAYSAVIALALVAAAVLVNIIIKFVLYRVLQRLLHILPPKGSDEYKVCLAIVSRLANIVPAIVLGAGAAAIPGIHEVPATLIRNISAAFIILVFTLALGNILDLVDIIYHRRSESANRPIKGYLQLLKICFWAVALILTVATLINKSPLMLLSGLGAMAAVLILIFQDTILSVVAALQIRSNDMIRIGDWIEMPTQNTDGYVIEIALHTIKVQNWDKTISTLPVRKLITDSFKNWRGMFEAGGRRIKRSLYIDQRSVRFLTEDEIAKLEDFVLINDYLEHKKQARRVECEPRRAGCQTDQRTPHHQSRNFPRVCGTVSPPSFRNQSGADAACPPAPARTDRDSAGNLLLHFCRQLDSA